MFFSFREKLTKYSLVSSTFLVSAAFVAGGWLWASVALRGATQPIIIHWSSVQGITQIGSVRNLTEAGILGLVVVAVNFFIALALEERDWFLGKLLAAATLVFSILLFIGFAAIISVN